MEGTPARWAGGVVLAVIVGLLAFGLWSQSRGDAAPGPSVSEVVEASGPPAASEGPEEGEASDSAEAEVEPEAEAEPVAEPPDEAPPASEPPPVVSPSPEPPPPPPAEPGPATGPWPELAPAAEITHPDTDPYIAGWYDLVGYFQEGDPTGTFGGNPSGDWTNKAEIWDQLAGQLRAEVAEAGIPHADPVFSDERPGSGRAQTRWSNGSTQERGELVEFLGQFTGPDGRVRERLLVALVVTNEDGSGTITGTTSFDMDKSSFVSLAEYEDALREREWVWVVDQPAQQP